MFIEYLKRNWFGLILLKFYVLLRTSSFKMAFNFGRQDYEIIEIEDFLTSEECDKLINMSKQKNLMVSTISDENGEGVVNLKIRKSHQVWLKDDENKLIEDISKRIQEYIPMPLEHQEDLQIVKYTKDDFYKHHYDTPYKDLPISKFNRLCGPRLATFLIYLNDDFEGGETEFIIINRTIKPKKGKAILFYNIDINLTLIPESMHRGKIIKKGEKWIANKWIRVWPFRLSNTFHITQNSWMVKVKKCN